MTQEKRHATRRPLIASAELIDVGTDARLKARTSDMSAMGCYLDTMTTLPAGTEVRVKISHNEATVTALGVIVNSQPHLGMGVRFTDVSLEDRELLQKWLGE